MTGRQGDWRLSLSLSLSLSLWRCEPLSFACLCAHTCSAGKVAGSSEKGACTRRGAAASTAASPLAGACTSSPLSAHQSIASRTAASSSAGWRVWSCCCCWVLVAGGGSSCANALAEYVSGGGVPMEAADELEESRSSAGSIVGR